MTTEVKELIKVHDWEFESEEKLIEFFKNMKDEERLEFYIKQINSREQRLATYNKVIEDKHNEMVRLEQVKRPMNTKQKNFYKNLYEYSKDRGWYLVSVYYIDAKTNLLFRCPEGHLVWIKPNSFKRSENSNSNGCLKCNQSSPELAEQNFNRNIIMLCGIVVGKYLRKNIKTLTICAYGHVCHPHPTSISQGQGMCQVCARVSKEQSAINFNNNVIDQSGIVIGQYIDKRTPILCICRLGHRCTPTPNNVRDGHNICIRCAGCSSEQSEEDFLAELAARKYIAIGKYSTLSSYITVECDKKHKYQITPTNVKRGQGYCTTCYPISACQGKIRDALDLLKEESDEFKYVEEFRFYLSAYRYDFKVGNFLIEFDGKQHFCTSQWIPTEEELKESQKTDKYKMEYILRNGYAMLRFNYKTDNLSVEKFASQIKAAIETLKVTGKKIWISEPSMYPWLELEPEEVLSHKDLIYNELEEVEEKEEKRREEPITTQKPQRKIKVIRRNA